MQMGEERQDTNVTADAQFDKIFTENTDNEGGVCVCGGGGGITLREKVNQGKEEPALCSQH